MSAAEVGPSIDVCGQSDWAIPCEYLEHRMVGHGPAEWAVWTSVPPCGCESEPDFRYFCDGCWEFRSRPGSAACGTCRRSFDARSNIMRAERITR